MAVVGWRDRELGRSAMYVPLPVERDRGVKGLAWTEATERGYKTTSVHVIDKSLTCDTFISNQGSVISHPLAARKLDFKHQLLCVSIDCRMLDRLCQFFVWRNWMFLH